MENNGFNSPLQQNVGFTNPNNVKPKGKSKKTLIILVALLIFFIGIVGAGTNAEKDPSNNKTTTVEKTTKAKSGEDYEFQVFDAFWSGICGELGVQYSDCKETHTAYSYICDYTTTDGYTAYYYLINTAYETENIYGKKVLHPITARCYYVPDYSKNVILTYMTVDGEKVLFDEEKEDWVMGIG